VITWRIWTMLRNPPFGNPLFRRTLLNRSPQPQSEFQPYKIITPRFIGELVGVLFVCTAMLSPIFLILAAVAMLLILNGTIYSLVWSVRTSGTIARERERQTYDMCCVSPEGSLGVNWAICTGFLHRDNRLEQIHMVVRTLLGVGFVLVLLIALVLISNAGQVRPTKFAQEEAQQYALMIVHVGTAIALIYIDHVHSIVLGCLVGILVPSYVNRRIEAQLGTLGLYLTLQVSAYAVAGIIGLVILPAIYDETASGLAQISLAIVQVLIFYATREAMITYLWNKLVERLNVTPDEESLVARPAFKLGFKTR
jgi:hypothetical protein